MHLTEFLVSFVTQFIDSTGYLTVFIGMTLESMVFPLPSEAILPFAGFLVVEGRFSYQLVVLAATLGSILGSGISYAVGYALGKPFVRKFGKYVLLDMEELEAAERFFNRRGELTIFVCRFIPVIRHLISIPAGFGKMNAARFFVFTILGAGLWNAILTYAGCLLKQHWNALMRYTPFFDAAVILVLVALVALYVRKALRKRAKARAEGSGE